MVVLPANEIDDDGDDFVECVFHSEGWDGDSNVTAGNDCDDEDDTIYPSVSEICDGLINACGGSYRQMKSMMIVMVMLSVISIMKVGMVDSGV